MQNRGLVFLYDAPLATQTPIVGPGMQIVSSSLKLTDQATRKANGGGAAVNHAAGCTSLGGATTTTLVPNKSMTSTGKVDAEKAQLLMLSEESLDLLQRAGAPAPPPGRAPALNFTSGLSERLARRLTVERSNPTRTVTYVGAGTQERFYVEVASNHVVKPASTSTKSTSCTSGAGTGGGGKNGDNNANAKNYNPTSSKVVNLSANNKASSSTVVTSNGNANNKNGGKSSGGGVRIQPAGANNRMSNNYPVRIQPKAEQPGVHLAAPKKSKSSDSPNDDDDNQQHKQNEEVSFFFHGPDALRKVLEKRRAEHNLQRAKMMAGAHHSMMKSSASVQLVAAPHSTSATLTSRATAAGQQHARSKDREEGQLPSSERLAATAAECAACLQSCQKQFLKERKAGAGDPPHKLQQGKKKSNPSWSSANRRLVNSIAFGSDWETFLVVFPDGSWELGGSGIPKTLTEKLWDTSPQDSRRPRSDLVCVHLGPRGEWYLEMQDGERWWGGIPDDFAQQLQPDRVRRIYFGSQGTYAVRSCDAKDLASDMNGAIAGDHTTRDVDMM
ncbi:unnamed protein product [Amoebophrya sp. A25]|nr:unnamed protein product [Amoebophrya sp. A25]|eukprot:GSA25T00013172001.1